MKREGNASIDAPKGLRYYQGRGNRMKDRAYVIYFNNGYLRVGCNRPQSLYMATMFATREDAMDDIDKRKPLWSAMDYAIVLEVTAEYV
jgi:hypothetical protein